MKALYYSGDKLLFMLCLPYLNLKNDKAIHNTH